MPKSASIVLAAALAATAAGQAKFELSTVKPNPDFRGFIIQNQPGGRFQAKGTLKVMMTEGYAVRDFQITGGPSWIGTESWDIVAKAEGFSDRIPLDQLRPMFRALIEDRFQLKVHRESKEMAVYNLTV